jgi:uncharacterized protein (DUF433 family)
MHENLLAHVIVDPAVCGGRACLRESRIAVTDVLDRLAAGSSPSEVLGDYPPLTPLDVQAALAYAAHVIRAADNARMAPGDEQG